MGKTFRKERDENKNKSRKSFNSKPKKDLRSFKGYSSSELTEEDFYEEE
jgi:hypothetical protein